MNPFLLPSRELLSAWREFRDELKQHDESTQLDMVAKWFSQAPTVKFVLDYDDPNWPTAWEILSDGLIDEVAKAYLMEQTLLLVGWNPEKLSLQYIRDSQLAVETMILVVDSKKILNMVFGEVSEIDLLSDKTVYLKKYYVDSSNTHVSIK